jgi:hypothetical protein
MKKASMDVRNIFTVRTTTCFRLLVVAVIGFSHTTTGGFILFPGIQEKLGILNGGRVSAVYDYEAQNTDELTFRMGDELIVLRKGDDYEREWWWSRLNDHEGYVPRNLLGVSPTFHLSVLFLFRLAIKMKTVRFYFLSFTLG